MAKINDNEIKITDILHLEEYEKYKLHAATVNQDGWRPLDAFLENIEDWFGWNSYYPNRDDFNRDYIFSIMEFYPKPGTWLFGGVFKVIGFKDNSYIIEEVKKYQNFTGRLLLNFDNKERARRIKMENYIDKISVNQIFEFRYSGEMFQGFESINHNFLDLEPIFKINKSDWKDALDKVKVIYLLTDKETGKSYIGSAYGNNGIWARWSQYFDSFHGGNDQLITLLNKKGKNYFRENIKFSLLEIYGMNISDEDIITRENYWKNKLMTKEHGYNSN